MKTKMIWANLGVKDVARSKDFYTNLGFKPNGANNSAMLVSFLFGDKDFVIHFFERTTLNQSMGGKLIGAEQGNEVIFTLAADNPQEVDSWAVAVRKAGGTIFQEPGFYKGYYTCGFADPDGHQFNVLSMEGM